MEKLMAENSTIVDNIIVGNNFTEAQVKALRDAFEVYENRMVAVETLAASFGDLSAADANDTLAADAQGVFQVVAVP